MTIPGAHTCASLLTLQSWFTPAACPRLWPRSDLCGAAGREAEFSAPACTPQAPPVAASLQRPDTTAPWHRRRPGNSHGVRLMTRRAGSHSSKMISFRPVSRFRRTGQVTGTRSMVSVGLLNSKCTCRLWVGCAGWGGVGHFQLHAWTWVGGLQGGLHVWGLWVRWV